METEKIIFWTVIAFCVIVFVVIFSGLLKKFGELLKKAEKHGEELKKQQKLYNNSSNGPKTFHEVIIEPYSGSELSDVLREMKILSTFIKLPVRAIFNNKKLRITSTTNLDEVVSCYYNDVDTDSVHKI